MKTVSLLVIALAGASTVCHATNEHNETRRRPGDLFARCLQRSLAQMSVVDGLRELPDGTPVTFDLKLQDPGIQPVATTPDSSPTVAECNATVGACNPTVLYCNPTDSDCTSTDQECNDTDEYCSFTDENCVSTNQQCNYTDQECFPTGAVCAPTEQACNVTVAACNHTDANCDQTNPHCFPTVANCNATVAACNATARRCNPTEAACNPTICGADCDEGEVEPLIGGTVQLVMASPAAPSEVDPASPPVRPEAPLRLPFKFVAYALLATAVLARRLLA